MSTTKTEVTGRQAAEAIDARLEAMAAPKNGSGSISVNVRLTLNKDALGNAAILPKQCQLVVNYLTALGGSATVAEINKLADRAKGAQAWALDSGQPYEQTPQKIISHYMPKLNGSAVWSKSKGKVTILTA